jgi:hypothetical protein
MRIVLRGRFIHRSTSLPLSTWWLHHMESLASLDRLPPRCLRTTRNNNNNNNRLESHCFLMIRLRHRVRLQLRSQQRQLLKQAAPQSRPPQRTGSQI